MRRVIGSILFVTYFLFFSLVVLLWVRSLVAADHVRRQSPDGFHGIVSSRGNLAVYSYEWPRSNPAITAETSHQVGKPVDIIEVESERAAIHRAFAGFHFFRDSRVSSVGPPLRGWCLVVPYWFLALLFGLIPLGRLLRLWSTAPRKPVPAAPPSAPAA